MKKLTTQEACNVLSAWTVLEILTPQTFKKPEDLVGGNQKLIASLDSTLPWENGGEKVPSKFTLFYQIVLGSINVTNAFSALNKKYTDSGVEAKVTSGEAIIAIIIVDQKGCVISGYNPINLASFAWGTPKALKGNIKELNRWSITESTVKIELGAIIRKINHNGEVLPLNKLTIQEAYNYLVNTFDIPAEMLINKQFAIRSYEPHKEGFPANFPSKIPLLNSFYLNDLEKATKVIKDSKDNTNLLQYLGVNIPSNRHNILDDTVLADTLAPKNIPSARWPGPGRQPLVLLQQAAVNLAMTKLNDGGILAINGPPGTGKTTLLRDIVAELVSKRAEALLKFDDPEKAFTNSGNTVKSRSSRFDIYTLDESIKSFEILIASSNNKAVENISAELPNLKAIASDADDLRYFTPLSDALLGYSSWGMISAMLGNSTNRINFSKKFWRNQDFGLDTYLAEINGTPQIFHERDPVTKKITKTRTPQIIQDSNPPRNRSEALIRWRQVCNHFKQVLQTSRTRLAELQEIKNLLQYLADIAIQLEPGEGLNDLLSKHNKHKPCIISSILKTSAFRSWQKKNQKLTNFQYTQKNIYELFSQLAPHIVDKNLFLKSPKEKYVVSPWCDAQTHSLRDEVFIAAIKVHKAFIDAAAKPLLHNLGAWMENFTNSTTVMECLADLWSSFFLVVPTISTTFASVEKMLQGLPLNYLGWLLIDEAGQALPQAAVGAIMRTKRIIITGDPLQIEPIVILPDSLTKNICKQFEVSPDNFNAPEASVQTLANAVSPYILNLLLNMGIGKLEYLY
ncbi:AAA domain-containing protein [Candidatus Tisiphia endosymbiont of Oplodontha viridula]|uniref:AAA domain-containing protein n=1 Tax=Candidatus Tisiphia endosymbiont of Oplodontha viridula TaxID=3077925 RepID=UPI0035C89D33